LFEWKWKESLFIDAAAFEKDSKEVKLPLLEEK